MEYYNNNVLICALVHLDLPSWPSG